MRNCRFPIAGIFLSMLILCVFAGCKQYPKGVQDALAQAGDNAAELMAVMEHYRATDSLKYEAACFLVENMPYHYSAGTMNVPVGYAEFFSKVDSLCRVVPSIINNDSIKEVLAAEFSHLPQPVVTDAAVPDVKTVSKDFLFEVIDEAFYEWETSPLLQGISFDEFKEAVLPYRAANEPITGGKEFYREMMYNRLTVGGMSSIRQPVEQYKQYTDTMRKITRNFKAMSHIGPYDIFLPMFKSDCANLAAITCNIFRANGIPVVYEFTPQWEGWPEGHFWCSSPDSTGRYVPYTPPFNNLGEDWDLHLQFASKVYRRTYALNRETPACLRGRNEHIPAAFGSPTICDVTANYHECADISLPADFDTGGNRLAYLSLFNSNADGNTNIVGWGTIDGDSVRYKNVPVDILFFPTYINGDGQAAGFGHPFILRKDVQTGHYAIQEIPRCDEAATVSLHILRKYPHKPHLVDYRRNLQGARLMASNSLGGKYETLLTIDSVGDTWKRFNVDSRKAYRYYRLETCDNSPLHIAEYEFLSRDDQGVKHGMPTPLPVFDADGSANAAVRGDEYMKIEGAPMWSSGPLFRNACDGNLDTYIESPWCGMSFDRPVRIAALQLYPRNARNGIEPGNVYQLLYYKDGEWIEHSVKESEYHYIDFDNVPGNTLYWVRNLTSGKDELPFFYIDGRQVFINEL